MTAALPGEPTFRCARSSVLRDEVVAGTASTVRAYLLIEHVAQSPLEPGAAAGQEATCLRLDGGGGVEPAYVVGDLRQPPGELVGECAAVLEEATR